MKLETVPAHIAIIPDGNRRWAALHGKEPWEGHRAGAEALKAVLDEALRLGMPHLTFWAASEDNLTKRSRPEVAFLGKLFEEYFKKLAKEPKLHKERVRVRVIGKWATLLPEGVGYAIKTLEDVTKEYDSLRLTFLVGYSGDSEMKDAIHNLRTAKTAQKNKGGVTNDEVREHLWTGFLPDVDLVIRTGGEPHWSAGFMMWLTQNSEFYFTPKLWPDFGPADLRAALAEYQSRRRLKGV